MKVQKIGWTIVQLVATDLDVVIVTKMTNTESCMFDVIDVVRSGLSDCKSHPCPEDHTHWEP